MEKFDISKFTLEEIIKIKSECENFIRDYDDGYIYICKVRSYGRNWTEELKNKYDLETLCSTYDGYDGIVDVFSNNPDLEGFHNYGDVYYIKSKHDYERWKSYESLVSQINEIEELWAKWDNRENLPYMDRPRFEPYGTKAEVEIMKGWLREFDMSFEPPKKVEFIVSSS